MSDPLWVNREEVSPGVFEPAYNALELRRAMAMFVMGGVTEAQGARQGIRPGHTPASLAATTWTVHDLVATVFPALTATSGIYAVGHAEESGSLDPAAVGNDRIDRIDLQIRDHDEDGSGFRDSVAVYTAGVPGSGAPPAQVANSLEVATINVPADGTGSPTLTVIAPFTVAPGAILPVRDSTERPTAGLYGGMGLWDQALGELQFRHGGAWPTVATAVAQARRMWRTVTQSIPNATETRLTWSTGEADGDISTSSGKFIVGRDGWYQLSAGVLWAANGTGIRELKIDVNATTVVGDHRDGGAGNDVLSAGVGMKLAAGDEVEAIVEQTSGASLDVLGAPRTFLSVSRSHP